MEALSGIRGHMNVDVKIVHGPKDIPHAFCISASPLAPRHLQYLDDAQIMGKPSLPSVYPG